MNSDLELWLRAAELGDCDRYPLTKCERFMIAKLRDAIALAKEYAPAAELSRLIDQGVP